MTFDAYLPLGLTTQDAITAMAGGAAFLTVYLVWQALLIRTPGQRRLKELATRRDALRAGITAAPKRGDRRAESLDVMRRTVNWLKLLRGQQGQRTAERLAQAGWRSRDAIIVFLFMKAMLPIVFVASVLFFLFALDLYSLPLMGKLGATAVCLMLGVYAPDIFVKNAADKRRKMLKKGMPDALDLMVICAEAGLSLDAALGRVARETAPGCPPLADEFELTLIELGFLPDRRAALENLAGRTGLPAIDALTNALMQTEKYGTPLAQSLRILAAELRNERLMKAEEKAARLPATLTVPMVLFILPSLFIVLIGPGALDVIDGLRGLG
jgi:tight adherence protein C